MKRFLFLSLVVGSIFFLSLVNGQEQILENSEDERESTIMYALVGILNYLHFAPQEIDDSYSQKVWNEYLKEIDGGKRFLLQEDVVLLSEFKTKIDDDVELYAFDFFDLGVQLIENAEKRTNRIYSTLIEGEFDLKIEETFELDDKKRAYAKNELQLVDRWRKMIKYNMVTKIDAYSDDVELDKLTDQEKYEKAKNSVQVLFDGWFERLEETRRSDRFVGYINVLMHQFDPHTEYFSPRGKENFDIRMGNKLEGIGARLEKAGDYIKINSIVPGGPAWKGEDLEEGDIIYSVKQKDGDEVDIAGMRMDDAIAMIRGDKGTIVILKVKKKDGRFENITIERDEVILEAAAAKSVILDLDDQVNNIGYINLPIFYSSFDGGTSCSADVEKEIEKLNKEKVNGIILDLRYNGGGSLEDVISMAGLFIETGPILQVKSRDKKPEVHYDTDKSVKYDGPLIVLVNNVSASSSEILVGALQDYGRAIIVGGEQTFGKATVQGVYDLDRMITGESDIKPLGQIKLTTQKFYRINGKSNQLQGVIPDIILPDHFAYTEYGEDQYETALGYSEINGLKYSQDIYKIKNLDEIKTNSIKRVQLSPNFSMVKEYGILVEGRTDKTSYSLSLETYAQYIDEQEESLKPFEDLFEHEIDGLKIRNIQTDIEYINSEESRKERNDDFIDNLETDFYLKESMMIMKDMIAGNKGLVQK